MDRRREQTRRPGRTYRPPVLTRRGKIRNVTEGLEPRITDGGGGAGTVD